MREYIKVTEDITDKYNFWKVRHNVAVMAPNGVEKAIVALLDGLEGYRVAHKRRFDSNVEDDGVLADGMVEIAKGIRVLLNGEIGRLDAGTIDGYLVNILVKCGEEV